MAPKARYVEGEKVLCFHGPLLYEAKCLKSEIVDKHVKYFIHYSGWNKNWDEWVPEGRVLKYNEANVQKQKELEELHVKTKKPKNAKIAFKKETIKKEPTPDLPVTVNKILKPNSKTVVKAEKRSATYKASPLGNMTVAPECKKKKAERDFIEDPPMKPEIKIPLPQELNDWLVDDWDLVTRQKKLMRLPARVTVEHVIASYVKERICMPKVLPKSQEATLVHYSNKFRDLFNRLLGKELLYKFERPQYGEVLSEYKGSSMCQIYSAAHLLRILSIFERKMQELPSHATVSSTIALADFTNDLIKYMAGNLNFFSLGDYYVASPEYHRRAL